MKTASALAVLALVGIVIFAGCRGAVPTPEPTPPPTASVMPITEAPIQAEATAAPQPDPVPTSMPSPTSVPTSEPVPTLTPTPVPTPTATPTPTPPRPVPTATPVPPYYSAWNRLANARWLDESNPALASEMKSLPWVSDGIDSAESAVLQNLLYIATQIYSAASSITNLPWVQDGVEDLEAEAIDWMNNFSDVEVASLVVGLEWVQDGIEELEVKTIEELSYIAYYDARVASSVLALDWVQDGIEPLEHEAIDWMSNFSDVEVASSVVALGWVQDGVEELEVKTIQELSYIEYDNSEVAAAVIALGWVQDGIEDLEWEAIDWVNNFGDMEVASSVVALAWVQDGVEEREVNTIEELSYIDFYDTDEAARIVAMPFLETLDPPDVSAVKALSQLASFRESDFQRVLSHPTLINGITDYWAKIVATLNGVSKNNSDLVDTLLDPDQVTLEERTIDLPLAGETHLAIIRTAPGAERSMDLLEHAVRHSEEFMAVSFPTGYIGWLFGEAVTPTYAGTNFGTHIATLSKYDDADTDESEYTASHIAHEVAHYYWSGNSNWVDEGASDFMASTSENARSGGPIEVTNDPCAYARTISELEDLDVSVKDGADSAFICNYALGERLFVDLYRNLGEDNFREGLRDLYLLSQVEDEDGLQDDTEVGIEHLKAAFKHGEDADNALLDVVVGRWYDWTDTYDTSAQDTTPVNPRFRTVSGRIDVAYLAAAL